MLLHKLLVLSGFIFLDRLVLLLIKGLQLGLLESLNFLCLGKVCLNRFLQFLRVLLLIEHASLDRQTTHQQLVHQLTHWIYLGFFGSDIHITSFVLNYYIFALG